MLPNPIIAALSFYGETPVSGAASNKQIQEFLEAAGLPADSQDEVPWCSAFLVWIFQQCCIQTPANASAISWLNFSESTDQPTLGDVVVLEWGPADLKNHHVGLFIREKAEVVYILAGNQNNEVDIVAWRKSDVLSYRKLPL